MNVEIEFAYKQEVYFMHRNKVQKGSINDISISVILGIPISEYTIVFNEGNSEVEHSIALTEPLIFSSKEELLKSL